MDFNGSVIRLEATKDTSEYFKTKTPKIVNRPIVFTTSVKIALKGSLKGLYALPLIQRKVLIYANVKKCVKMCK